MIFTPNSWVKAAPWPMIVLNLTPDSFSDGGIHTGNFSLEPYLLDLESRGFRLIDVGAQSTAPSSALIDGSLEKKRLQEYFFDKLSAHFFEESELVFSLDTFRPETMFWFEAKVKSLGFRGKLIWNDVSGIVDEAVLDFINIPGNFYIYCHNRVRTREESPRHMEFAPAKFCFEDLLDFFKIWEGKEGFIFDPCFGFAKSYEENLFWLKELPRLMNSFDGGNPFLIGISRKSFLRRLIREEKVGIRVDEFKESETLHLHYLQYFLRESKAKDFFIRIHDPKIYLNLGLK